MVVFELNSEGTAASKEPSGEGKADYRATAQLLI